MPRQTDRQTTACRCIAWAFLIQLVAEHWIESCKTLVREIAITGNQRYQGIAEQEKHTVQRSDK